jgi:MbtH protein
MLLKLPLVFTSGNRSSLRKQHPKAFVSAEGHYMCGLEDRKVTNPFENEGGEFVVLTNDERQYSLWPAFCDIPAGWSAVTQKGNRKTCLDWIDENWTDMRPQSLVDAMNSHGR